MTEDFKENRNKIDQEIEAILDELYDNPME